MFHWPMEKGAGFQNESAALLCVEFAMFVVVGRAVLYRLENQYRHLVPVCFVGDLNKLTVIKFN